jgi:hypothetical protein
MSFVQIEVNVCMPNLIESKLQYIIAHFFRSNCNSGISSGFAVLEQIYWYFDIGKYRKNPAHMWYRINPPSKPFHVVHNFPKAVSLKVETGIQNFHRETRDIAALLLLKMFRYIEIEKGALCPYALAQQHNLLNSPGPQIINRQQPPFAEWTTQLFFSCNALSAQRVQQASKRCVDFTLLWQKARIFSLSLASSAAPQGCNHFLSVWMFFMCSRESSFACALSCSATTHSSAKLTLWEIQNAEKKRHIFIPRIKSRTLTHGSFKQNYESPKCLTKVKYQ